jgi:hypothetical protein
VFGALVAGLILAGALTGTYNARVTGSPLQMPYYAYEGMKVFVWRPFRENPPQLETAVPEKRSVARSRRRSGWKGPFLNRVERFQRAWRFYLGWALTLPLLFVPPVLGRPWVRFAAGTVLLVAAGNLVAYSGFPHYYAPVAPLLLYLVLEGLRRLGAWRPGSLPAGRALSLAVGVACLLTFTVAVGKHVVYAGQADTEEMPWFVRRAGIQRQLERAGGKHLIVVKYRSNHLSSREWVYNGADIDAAPVVWARDLGRGKNGPLFEHFASRQLWLLDADRQPPQLVRVAARVPGPAGL